ncbi:GNAT family N-acetyltransferase [Streptomyces fulvorobeus]|uniref:CelD/BcsL family acetyltransferase involved in cellulose biosynthesis n=1 Tax=Streptomyces fulvorobeus TaxID=284028 RepID=A0A7J0CBR6_9ACTN|nr:GNAT family N-acetyltransferase [Streptomyces fulvorobeus]NYE43497.1 CelD/BcsL family acetyltransferase involved in cellulose biosynthesis [Streptomyces fulvorobeus]GFM99970.1 glycosyl transferase family 1 [Streptomyces fulvorobeus]
MGVAQREGLAVTLCRDLGEFAGVADEWDALHRRCRTATPFQSHAWLHSWWLSYGRSGRMRVVLARRGGRLIGAAALMLVHRPMPLLVPMGGAISDFFDVLVDEEESEDALVALERGLDRAARHAVIDLREVRPDASAQLLYERWTGARTRLDDSTCMELPAEPITALLGRLPSSRAQRVRAKLRKIDALAPECRAVSAPDVPGAVGRILRLHELQWAGRGVNPEHLRPRFSAHLVRATRRMVRDGDAALTEFLVDGEVVAVNMSLQSGRLTGGYLYGAHPSLRERKVDVATMLLREVSRQAADTGRGVLSLLRGSEQYKNHWEPVPVVNQRLLLARSALDPLLRLRVTQLGARELAARTVRTRFPAARDWRHRLTALPVIGR